MEKCCGFRQPSSHGVNLENHPLMEKLNNQAVPHFPSDEVKICCHYNKKPKPCALRNPKFENAGFRLKLTVLSPTKQDVAPR